MNNHDAAQKVKDMSEQQRARLRKNLYGIILKCLAGIALVGAIGVFFVMNGSSDETSRYQNEGVVSQALVMNIAGNMVRVVHNPNSTVAFSDIGTKVQVAALPLPIAGAATGTLKMSDAEVAKVAKGQNITVVNTPYEPNNPRTLASLQAPTSRVGLVWASVLAMLAVALWMLGRWLAQ